MTRVGVVTGLVKEAKLVTRAARGLSAPDRPRLFSAAGDWRRAESGATALVDEGAEALLSFGVAGGLADGARAGDLILASEVVMAGQPPIATTDAWRHALAAGLARLGPCHSGPIVTVEKAATPPPAKRRLAQSSGAIAVDMESYGVALAAQAAGIPLVVIRAVSDPVGRAVPAAAAGAIGADGTLRLARLFGSLAHNPGEIPRMWRLGRDGWVAFSALSRVAVRIAPRGFLVAL